jgi:hypothetical protein
MAFKHGSFAVMIVNSVDVSTYLSEANLDVSLDTSEVTTLGSIDKSYIQGLGDGKFSLSGLFDKTFQDAMLSIRAGRVAVTFEYRPQGTGTGLAKVTGSCVITGMKFGTGVGDAGKLDVDFQATGTQTYAAQA